MSPGCEKGPLTASHVGPGILLLSTLERLRVVVAARRNRTVGRGMQDSEPLLGASSKCAGPHRKAHWLAGPGPLAMCPVKKLPPFKKKMDLKTMTGNRSHCKEESSSFKGGFYSSFKEQEWGRPELYLCLARDVAYIFPAWFLRLFLLELRGSPRLGALSKKGSHISGVLPCLLSQNKRKVQSLPTTGLCLLCPPS